MMIRRISGATRVVGKSQGYLGLPVRDEVINERVTGEGTPTMTTAWEPDPAELGRLLAGACAHVEIVGKVHPPIMVGVGEPPAEDVKRNEAPIMNALRALDYALKAAGVKPPRTIGLDATSGRALATELGIKFAELGLSAAEIYAAGSADLFGNGLYVKWEVR